MDPPFLVQRYTAAIAVLEGRLEKACADVARAVSATGCYVLGESFIFPSAEDAALSFVITAGPRALVALSFADLPAWTARVQHVAPLPIGLVQDEWTLVLPPRDPDEPEYEARVVATLRFYADVAIEAHLQQHPDDAAMFTTIDDAAAARMFGDEIGSS